MVAVNGVEHQTVFQSEGEGGNLEEREIRWYNMYIYYTAKTYKHKVLKHY
ncbi:hypothetical protein XIS1_1700064 [Xenorhabdus innexi]|uniref:Uncharacterized protein n=1 Tax=Xenorhabdus innexi TaxID=290109 RepID=A0A1N6MVU4_9GAMM|nr:hypothetical protein Xinn_00887 [Xenorhabdus innexi]SIP73013.1 hypothetical protein XIS1_1700064 [Xenorhabdus innexi]